MAARIEIKNLTKIQYFAARLQNYQGHPPRTLTPGEHDILESVLRDISSIDPMTPQIEDKLRLRDHLGIIVGEYPTVKHEYHFPDPFPDKAAAVLEKFQAINWGATEEDAKTVTKPTSSAAAVGSALPRNPPVAKPETSQAVIPKADHPIFGNNGIMRGILISSSGMRTYCIDSRFSTKDSNVVGNNGLSVGDWWPMQICALRDGAHGARMSGIAGSKTKGAFSIVVSGHYGNLDADQGHTLYYSGSQALENIDPKVPIISAYTEAMRLSFQLRRSVRVLRSSRNRSKYSPSKGLRYDGLYTITGEDTRSNAHGGAYIRFRLERDTQQPDIDTARPTKAEQRLCDLAREGY
ncbi:hypothetical protein MMC29_004758 [Sticta canariensis]|nr:hypothetical protein [Sticta canariensis]